MSLEPLRSNGSERAGTCRRQWRMQAGESVANKRALQVSTVERGRATVVSLTERSETEDIPPYQLRVAYAERSADGQIRPLDV